MLQFCYITYRHASPSITRHLPGIMLQICYNYTLRKSSKSSQWESHFGKRMVAHSISVGGTMWSSSLVTPSHPSDSLRGSTFSTSATICEMKRPFGSVTLWLSSTINLGSTPYAVHILAIPAIRPSTFTSGIFNDFGITTEQGNCFFSNSDIFSPS
jgi:hypothetical protein